MNTHIRYLIAIGVLLFFVLFFLNRMESLKREGRQKDSIISEKTDSIRYHRNENGRIVAEKSAALASIKELKDAYPHLEEELRRDFDVKFKNLKAYIRNEFEVRGSGIATVTNNYYDSTGTEAISRSLRFSDGYLEFNSTIDSENVAISNYTYRDTARTVIHAKRKWIFGKDRMYSSTTFHNPAARSMNATNLIVDSYRDKRFVVTSGIYFDPLRQSYGISIGLGYALIKF